VILYEGGPFVNSVCTTPDRDCLSLPSQFFFFPMGNLSPRFTFQLNKIIDQYLCIYNPTRIDIT